MSLTDERIMELAKLNCSIHGHVFPTQFARAIEAEATKPKEHEPLGPATTEDQAIYDSITASYFQSGALDWMQNIDSAIKEPAFQEARALMGTENYGQDVALLQSLRHVRSRMLQATKPQEPVVWNDGYPTNPWDSEWFIAKTKYGDKVVLRKLPDEYTYDFTTADGTYMKKENITKWMQFPESEFIAPHPVSDMDILDIVLKISEEMGLEDDEANLEFAQRVLAEATPQHCPKCADLQSEFTAFHNIAHDRFAKLQAKCAELEAELLNKEGMTLVTKEDAENYCRILSLLGMEEEGSPIEGVEHLISLRDGMTCGDCNDTGWLENREEGRYPCTCMTEAEPYQILEAKCAELEAKVEQLKMVPMKYRRMEFNAQLQRENMELRVERDALAAQLNRVRRALDAEP